MELSLVKVNVFPSQAEQFTSPHSGHGPEKPERVVLMMSGLGEECVGLVSGPCLGFVSWDPWGLNVFGRVDMNQVPHSGIFKPSFDHSVKVSNALGR